MSHFEFTGYVLVNMNELSDSELLAAYTSQRSEEAFRVLVARHVDFVYSAALRQLQNPHGAEEATQSAFIALAAKAADLPPQTVIPGWLHHAARFAALKLQRTEARRKHWEQEAAALSETHDASSSLDERALSQVDAALDELGDVDRDAVVLRFLQWKSLRDVAETLGTSEEAAKKRVSRALDKLRDVLARRGVAVSAVALATSLSQLPVSAAPAALSATVSSLAMTTAATGSAFRAATLLASTKAKLTLAVAVMLVGGLAVLLWPRRPPNPVITATPANTNPVQSTSMKIKLTSVLVDDQDKALQFYTQVLGFVKKRDFPASRGRWLTVVSPAEPDGAELLLEPLGFPPARAYQAAVFRARIPFTAFQADDVQREYERMSNLGAKFRSPPAKAGPTTLAVFEDTCGNRIQLFQSPEAGAGAAAAPAIKIKLTSVTVDDQEKALKFYTESLGFVKKTDLPAGGGRWLTVVSSEEPEGMELVLEPMGFAFSRTYQEALFAAGIPLTSFLVADVAKEHERLAKLGVVFRTKPAQTGPTRTAVFDDTCGNLLQIVQP